MFILVFQLQSVHQMLLWLCSLLKDYLFFGFSYWNPGEPNDFEGKNEDCVEIKFHDVENSWNDIPCGDQNFWICEKRIAS